jgi:hypothetical protein
LPTRSSRNETIESSLPLNVPDFIYIYKNNSKIDWDALEKYVETKLNHKPKIELRENFISYHIQGEEDMNSIAEKLVRTKVFDVSDPKKFYHPFPVEIKHEKDLILGQKKEVFGMLYDGFRLQKLFRELLPNTELSFKHLNIMFTGRSIGTWDKGDGRYHARTSVYGFPSIISTSGIVEAPAKPREFYILRKALIASGMTRELVEEELKDKFKGRFIDYNDERLIEIIKGYAMQAYFYHTTFEPFCEDKNCRLYNAHWQEDMIHAQLEGKDFCDRHEEILEGIRTRKI